MSRRVKCYFRVNFNTIYSSVVKILFIHELYQLLHYIYDELTLFMEITRNVVSLPPSLILTSN